jgi:hypothetical protein
MHRPLRHARRLSRTADLIRIRHIDRRPPATTYKRPSVGVLINVPSAGTHRTAANFREAVDAAGDWLDARNYHGRDGTWAARTLPDLTKGLPLQ